MFILTSMCLNYELDLVIQNSSGILIRVNSTFRKTILNSSLEFYENIKATIIFRSLNLRVDKR